MARSRRDGSCPYCDGTSFATHHERRPGQKVEQCLVSTCGKFSVRAANGTRYPLQVPEDPSSPPNT